MTLEQKNYHLQLYTFDFSISGHFDILGKCTKANRVSLAFQYDFISSNLLVREIQVLQLD